MNYPENVIKIAEIMAKHGFRAYAVGGCVRDSIMGRIPSDWDMTTNATPDKMIEIFDSENIRTIPTGLKHGTVTVLLDKECFELTTFRIDGSYTDSRHPDEVTFTKRLEDDLARRDFTVNAMAADPICENSDNEVTDVYGGRNDINNRIIRAVGDPKLRFKEDALRILRAVRFAATLGFDIEENTKKAAKELSSGLEMVSAERKKTELEKILMSEGADLGVNLLFELGLEKYIHADLKIPDFSISCLPKRFETRMAALLFNNAEIPELSGLKLSRVEATTIKKLCDKSRFCHDINEANARRMIYEYGDTAQDSAILYGNIELARLIRLEMSKDPCVSVSQLKITGNDLISVGIEPRKIGAIMSYLLCEVIDDPCLNSKDILIKIALDFNV